METIDKSSIDDIAKAFFDSVSKPGKSEKQGYNYDNDYDKGCFDNCKSYYDYDNGRYHYYDKHNADNVHGKHDNDNDLLGSDNGGLGLVEGGFEHSYDYDYGKYSYGKVAVRELLSVPSCTIREELAVLSGRVSALESCCVRPELLREVAVACEASLAEARVVSARKLPRSPTGWKGPHTTCSRKSIRSIKPALRSSSAMLPVALSVGMASRRPSSPTLA